MTNSRGGTGVRRFLKISAIYALGDALTKSARIILVPYYLAAMSQGEVGQVAILQAIIMATWALLSLGTGFGVRRFYVDEQPNPDAMVTAIWWVRWVIALPFFMALMGCGWLLAQRFQDLSWTLVSLAIVAGTLKAGTNVLEAWFVIREEPMRYRTFTFLQFLTSTILIIFCVSVLNLGVLGAVLGELASYIIFTGVSAWLLHRAAPPDFGIVPWRKFLAYCLPMVPHFFFMWGLTAADRIVLKFFVSLAEVGVYDVGYLLASFLTIFLLAMRSAWTPQYFRDAKESAEHAGFARTTDLFLFVIFGAALAGGLFAPEGIRWLVKPSYEEAISVFRVAVFGIAISGIFVALNQPLLFSGRTGLISLISGTGLLINLLANVLLIPQLGIIGAAWATVVSYCCISLALGVIIPTQFGIRWNWGYGVWLTLVSGVLLAIGSQWLSNGTVLGGFLKLCLLVAFCVLSLIRFHRQPSGGWKVVVHEFWRNSLGKAHTISA